MKDQDWTKPQAMAIPKGGFFTLEKGRYGPTYPRTPACYGFTIIAKIKPGTEEEIQYFMYQGIFDTDFDKYTEDAIALFTQTGINTIFEKLEGFPEDWKTNAPAFVKFVREHQCPSFLEYGEYPYVTAVEIKKALSLKKAFLEMLDQMQ